MFEVGNVYSFTMSDRGYAGDIGTSSWEVVEVNHPLVKIFNGFANETRIVNTGSVFFISATLQTEKVGKDYWTAPEWTVNLPSRAE